MDHYRVTLGLKLEAEVERKKHEHVEQEEKGILKLEIYIRMRVCQWISL